MKIFFVKNIFILLCIILISGCSKHKITSVPTEKRLSSINLHEYKIENKVQDQITIRTCTLSKDKNCEDIEDLSGITWWPKPSKDLLVFVSNSKPGGIGLLDLDGKLLDYMPFESKPECEKGLHCFKDPEGITHIKNNEFAIIDERKNTVVKVKLDVKNSKIAKYTITDIYPLKGRESKYDSNAGPEGIAFQPLSNQLFVVNEKELKALWKLPVDLSDKNINPIDCKGAENLKDGTKIRDWAGVSSIPDTNHWLIISSKKKSKSIIELDSQCNYIDELELSSFIIDPTCKEKDAEENINCIDNPEGVVVVKKAFNNDKKVSTRIYVLSEPNFLYIFKK